MPWNGGKSVYEYMLDTRDSRGAGFFVLMDPDRVKLPDLVEQAKICAGSGVDVLLVGTSLMLGQGFTGTVKAIRDAVDIPVVIFPGEKSQVSECADALLFLTLLSGRNPDLIIGEQVRSAPMIKSIGLEAISTAYLLIESGRSTSVEFMSNTRPIPANKPDIALAHAMVAELFGLKLVYLEAGSGAEHMVPDEMVKRVSEDSALPVIVGGGIRSPRDVAAKVNAGASFVVVGNHLEDSDNHFDLQAFVNAAHNG